MKGKQLFGFMYSYITKKGDEILITDTFGTSRKRSKERLYAYNNKDKLEPVKPHKRYEVLLSVVDEAPAVREDTL